MRRPSRRTLRDAGRRRARGRRRGVEGPRRGRLGSEAEDREPAPSEPRVDPGLATVRRPPDGVRHGVESGGLLRVHHHVGDVEALGKSEGRPGPARVVGPEKAAELGGRVEGGGRGGIDGDVEQHGPPAESRGARRPAHAAVARPDPVELRAPQEARGVVGIDQDVDDPVAETSLRRKSRPALAFVARRPEAVQGAQVEDRRSLARVVRREGEAELERAGQTPAPLDPSVAAA